MRLAAIINESTSKKNLSQSQLPDRKVVSGPPQMPKMESPAEAMLKKHGPLESLMLSERLVKSGQAANAASARKIIERSRKTGKIESTHPVRFDKSFLYFLKEHRGRRYASSVRALLPKKPGFSRVFKTILANKGWISEGQIGKASGCLPIGDKSRAGGRLPLDVVVQHLLKVGLIDSIAGHPGLFRIGKDFGAPKTKRFAFEKKLQLESSLLSDFRDWVRNCYLIAYESHTSRPTDYSAAEFNQSICDLHGPVYFGPFAQSKPLKRVTFAGSFLVAEILGYRQFTKNDAEATLERIGSIGHRWKSVAISPLVLAPSYSKEAWNRLRSAGVIALTFKNVFGRNIEELMSTFWQAISAEGSTGESVDQIEKSLELAKGTVGTEGFIGNLKGALFELIVALGYRAAGYDTTLQKVVRKPDVGEEYEIDVVAMRGEAECKLIECKGQHAEYEESEAELMRHFSNRCQAASDAYGWHVTDRYKEVEAIFITSGKLDSAATAYAASTNASHGIKCAVMQRLELLDFLDNLGQQRLVKIIKSYY